MPEGTKRSFEEMKNQDTQPETRSNNSENDASENHKSKENNETNLDKSNNSNPNPNNNNNNDNTSKQEQQPSQKRRRKGKGKKKNKQNQQDRRQSGWEAPDYHNHLLERFYSESNIIPASEWQQFMETIKSPLPTTFRINTATPFAKSIQKQVEEYFIPLFEKAVGMNGEKIHPPRPIPWYPDQMGWYLSASRSTLRKDPSLAILHKFLVMHTDHGNVSRQEEVSMLPPFFLNVQPHHRILDMCAAPGSKTGQLMEMLKARSDEEHPMTGYVVANDSDQRRSYLLVHQLQRMNNLFPHVIVTNHDARRFPNLIVEDKDGNYKKEKFDRVLCDVICSGDGTIRKCLNMWKAWTPQLGPNLHTLQIDIASRGIQVLRPGGRMVYSTCSMNPVEDEAVVAELLRRYKGKVRLADAASSMGELRYQKGMSTWPVMSTRGRWYRRHSELPEDASRLQKTMFEPTQEEAEWMNLDMCMRMLPHHGDNGGFFVAVFENIEDVNDDNSNEHDDNKSSNDNQQKEIKKKEKEEEEEEEEEKALKGEEDIQYYKGKSQKEGEGRFTNLDKDTQELLKNFYQIDDDFNFDQILSRSRKEGSRKLFFVSPSVQRVIENNEKHPKWRIVNAGLRMFERSDSYSRCKYRITQEAASLIEPHMGSRKVRVSYDDLVHVVDNDKISIEDLSSETKAAINNYETGTLVLYTEGKVGNKVHVVVFRGEKTLNRMVKKTELGVVRFALDPTYIPPPKQRHGHNSKNNENSNEQE